MDEETMTNEGAPETVPPVIMPVEEPAQLPTETNVPPLKIACVSENQKATFWQIAEKDIKEAVAWLKAQL